jgi:hypothetical protein
MLRPVVVAIIALLLVAPQHNIDAHAASFTGTPSHDLVPGASLRFAAGLRENDTDQPPVEHSSSQLATTDSRSPWLMIAAIAGGCLAALVILLAFVARHGAFSRNVDHRRVSRAKFQDDWTGVIRAADERAREIAERKQK